MKRDDIIGQKLFETSKLSEFYLNLILNSTLEEESPLQLANAFTHKLNEIVDRYDRLLEVNKQKEHFSLSFDHTKSASQTIKHKPPTPTIPLGRCSTPNKGFNTIGIHSTATTPSDSSTPNYLNSFFRKSHSNLSLNKHWNSSTSNINLSRKQSHKNYYTRQLIYNAKSPNGCAHSNENTTVKFTKLCQRIASIYYGSESEDDDINTANDTSDEIDIKYDFSYKQDLSKFDNDILKYINENTQTNKNDLLITSTISSSESSSSHSGASANSNNYECSISDNNSTMSAHIADVTQTPNQIGKSYSNLSKDSGVFMGESYHSEYSNSKLTNMVVNTTPKKIVKNKKHQESGIENDGDNEDEEDDVDDEEEDFAEKNLNSPLSSQDLNENEETDEYDETKNEFKKNAQQLTNQFVWGAINPNSNTNMNSLDEKDKEEEQDEPQVLKPIPSLKEHFLQNHKNHGSVDSRTYRKMLPSAIRSRQHFMQSEYTSKIKYINQLNQYKSFKPLTSSSEETISAKQNQEQNSEINYDLASKGIEPGLMSMMIDAKNDGHYNISDKANDFSNTSLNYEETTSNSSVPLEQNYSASVNDLTNTKQNLSNKQLSNETGLFFNNSLMNVSMLDNIQATNTNLDYMNSSILMFN